MVLAGAAGACTNVSSPLPRNWTLDSGRRLAVRPCVGAVRASGRPDGARFIQKPSLPRPGRLPLQIACKAFQSRLYERDENAGVSTRVFKEFAMHGVRAADAEGAEAKNGSNGNGNGNGNGSNGGDPNGQYQQQMQAQEVRRWYANMGKTPIYEVLSVDTNGITTNKRILRRDLLRNSGLQPRDLRRIDPSLALTTAAPSLLVRDKAILINLGSVRLICHEDHALVFEPSSAIAQSFLEGLLVRLAASHSARLMFGRTGPDGQGAHGPFGGGSAGLSGLSGLGSDDAAAEGRHFSATGLTFELEVVEAALLETTSQLDAKLLSVTERVAALERTLPGSITPDALEELRSVKQALVELDSQAGSMRQLLLEVLDDEDDVQKMSLSSASAYIRAAAPGADADALLAAGDASRDAIEEVENLLEYYLQRCETCHGEAERLLAGARDLEESISVALSSRRYEVNKLELMLSIGTFATAIGAMVAGIFGMNMYSRLEMHATAFWAVSGSIVAMCALLIVLLFAYTKKRRIL